jgi:hypothetical protein
MFRVSSRTPTKGFFSTLRWRAKIRESPEGWKTLDREAQAKALRLRMYVLCSKCARLIDFAEGNRQQREVEAVDLVRHSAEEHAAWLEVPTSAHNAEEADLGGTSHIPSSCRATLSEIGRPPTYFCHLSRNCKRRKTGWWSGVDSNPRCREGFQGRNSARVWRAIRSDKKHPCSREFCSLGIWLCLGSLWFASFAKVERRSRRTVDAGHRSR